MELNQILELIDYAAPILAILFPALAVYVNRVMKTKAELVKLLDHSPVNNRALKQMAKNLGAKKAAKEIDKLAE